jgi:hypothetical protein
MNPIYLALMPDGDVKKFADPISAWAVGPIGVVKEIFVRDHITRFGNRYPLNAYTFVSGNGGKYDPSLGRWKIVEIDEGKFLSKYFDDGSTTWSVANEYSFQDPLGEICGIYLDGVKEGLEKLRYLSKFGSWLEVSLQDEIDKLREENERLKAIITTLEQKN